MTTHTECIISCCKVEPEAADIEQIRTHIAQQNTPDLSEFATLAHFHGVFPLVYQVLHTYADDLICEQDRNKLKKSMRKLVAENMYMTDELIQILELLAKNGIQALAFKGPALSQLAYGDPTQRQYCDLDILIKKQDIAKSIASLAEYQYLPDISLPDDAKPQYFACVNVIGLGGKTRLEVHWELLSKNYAIDWQEDTLWQENDTTAIDGKAVPILAYNAHLLYLCAHGSKHFFEQLKWVCDIDRLIRTKPELDWKNLFEDAQALGIERMLLLGLYLCHEMLALPLPADVSPKVLDCPAVKKLGQQIIGLHYSTSHGQGRSFGNFSLLWRMREHFSDRLRFAYRAMFAPKYDDFIYVALPSQLTFLYPIIRPFRLALKYFNK